MNKNAIYYSVIIWMFYSCNNDGIKMANWQLHYSISLNEAKDFFGEENCNYFPESSKMVQELIVYTPSQIEYQGFMGFFVCSKSDEINLELLAKNAIAIQNSQDSCMPIIQNSLRNADHIINSFFKRQEMNCPQHTLPVPDFSMYNENGFSVKEHLTADFTLYILDAQSGVFCDDKYITEGNDLSVKWVNGMSKGIAVSLEQKIAIYWLAIW